MDTFRYTQLVQNFSSPWSLLELQVPLGIIKFELK